MVGSGPEFSWSDAIRRLRSAQPGTIVRIAHDEIEHPTADNMQFYAADDEGQVADFTRFADDKTLIRVREYADRYEAQLVTHEMPQSANPPAVTTAEAAPQDADSTKALAESSTIGSGAVGLPSSAPAEMSAKPIRVVTGYAVPRRPKRQVVGRVVVPAHRVGTRPARGCQPVSQVAVSPTIRPATTVEPRVAMAQLQPLPLAENRPTALVASPPMAIAPARLPEPPTAATPAVLVEVRHTLVNQPRDQAPAEKPRRRFGALLVLCSATAGAVAGGLLGGARGAAGGVMLGAGAGLMVVAVDNADSDPETASTAQALAETLTVASLTGHVPASARRIATSPRAALPPASSTAKPPAKNTPKK
jgi:hypothetical protein